MFPIPWYVAAFQSIPEAILIQVLTLKFMQQKQYSIPNVLIVSILYGAATFIVRYIAYCFRQLFLFSLHTILLILIIMLLFSLIHKIKLRDCFMPIFIVSLFYGLVQFTFILIVFNMYNLRPQILEEKPWFNIAFFIPIAAITYIALHLYIGHGVNKCE